MSHPSHVRIVTSDGRGKKKKPAAKLLKLIDEVLVDHKIRRKLDTLIVWAL